MKFWTKRSVSWKNWWMLEISIFVCRMHQDSHIGEWQVISHWMIWHLRWKKKTRWSSGWKNMKSRSFTGIFVILWSISRCGRVKNTGWIRRISVTVQDWKMENAWLVWFWSQMLRQKNGWYMMRCSWSHLLRRLHRLRLRIQDCTREPVRKPEQMRWPDYWTGSISTKCWMKSLRKTGRHRWHLRSSM